MAELVGLVSGIFALIQIAAQVSAWTHEYVGKVSKASEDIVKLSHELESLNQVLLDLHNIAKEDPESVVLRGLRNQIRDCTTVLERFQQSLKTPPSTTRFKWRKRLFRYSWPLKEQDNLEYISLIERRKSGFMITLEVYQL